MHNYVTVNGLERSITLWVYGLDQAISVELQWTSSLTYVGLNRLDFLEFS